MQKPKRVEMKKRMKRGNVKYLFIIAIAILGLNLTSCSEDIVTNKTTTERVDIKISGDVINSQSNEATDLATGSNNPNTILNSGEYLIRLNIDANTYVDFTLYNKLFTNQLEADFSYSAFSKEILSQKISYVVADYYSNGVKTFSSASSLATGKQQLNVFKTVEKEDFYLITLSNFELFGEAREGNKEKASSIFLNGTFTLLK